MIDDVTGNEQRSIEKKGEFKLGLLYIAKLIL